MEDIMLLPGFRFHPTDEELVGFYLKRKVQQRPIAIELIKQLDIYKYDPWDLPKMASATGEKEWYFLCPRDRKYRNSMRPNRVTASGFWKATGTDRPIYSSEGPVTRCIGLKKSLVFYKGRAARGTKTEWMMHEFRLSSAKETSILPSKRFIDRTIPANDAWAICRIFKKTSTATQRSTAQNSQNWDCSPIFQATMSDENAENPSYMPSAGTGSISFTPSESNTVPNISFTPNSILSQQQLDFTSYKLPNWTAQPASSSLTPTAPDQVQLYDYEAYFDFSECSQIPQP
ncbi:unnamed protein product [Rhodiola kirilowii]